MASSYANSWTIQRAEAPLSDTISVGGVTISDVVIYYKKKIGYSCDDSFTPHEDPLPK